MSVLVPIAPQSRLALLDVCCLGVLAIRLPSLWRVREVRTTAALLVLYSTLLAASALLHGLPLSNLIRRDYGAVFLVVEAFGIYALLREGGFLRQALLIVALTIGISFHYFYPTDERVLEQPIKFLLGIPLGVFIAVSAAILAGRSPLGRQVSTLLLVAYALMCLLSGDRSVGAMFFLTAVLIHLKLGFVNTRRYKLWYPLVLVGGLVLAIGLSELYASLAISGAFGESAARIASYQKQLFGSLLLGGRPEVMINLLAISDSPFIGHGPLAQTPKYLDAFALLGIYEESYINEDEQVLYHSMLFTAGHEAGIFAAMFWAYLLHKLTFSIPVVIQLGRRIAPAVLPFLFCGIWNILFSPLNSYARWQVAIGVALAFFWVEMHRRSIQSGAPRSLPVRNEKHTSV